MAKLFNKSFSNQSVGIVFMLLHCCFIALSAVLLKIIQQNMNIFQIMFIYNSLIFIFLLAASFTKITAFQLTKVNIGWHFIRSIFGFSAFLLCFYSLSKIDVTEVRAILTLDPIVTSLLALYFFNEALSKEKIAALIITIIGALILLHPSNMPFSLPVVTSVLSAFCFSIYNNLTKKISNDSPINSLFFLSLFSSLFTILPAIYFWKSVENTMSAILLLSVAVFFLLSSVFVFSAFKRADLSYLMPFHFVGLMFTAFFSYLLLNEVVGFLTYLGSFIIVLGTLPLFYKKRTLKRSYEPKLNSY